MVVTERSYHLIDNFYPHDQEFRTRTKKIGFPETSWSSRDERIDLVPIAAGLKDLLTQAGITLEYLLNNDALKLSQMLGIEECIVRLIQHETRKLIK